MTLMSRSPANALAVCFVVVVLLALATISTCRGASLAYGRQAERSRERSVAVVSRLTQVPIRRACLGSEGDGVRTYIAETGPLSSQQIAALQARLAQDARVMCELEVLGPGDPAGTDVPAWFDSAPLPSRVVDRCDYYRVDGRSHLLLRTDGTALVYHREHGIRGPEWPDGSELGAPWALCE